MTARKLSKTTAEYQTLPSHSQAGQLHPSAGPTIEYGNQLQIHIADACSVG